MEITMDIPDDLAVRLQSRQDQLPQIIELGLRNLDATTPAAFPSASDRPGACPYDELLSQLYPAPRS